MDKSALVQFVRVIIIKVMYYPIPKICCKYFALLGVGNNKTSRRIRFVGSVVKFIAKRVQVAFQIGFKS